MKLTILILAVIFIAGCSSVVKLDDTKAELMKVDREFSHYAQQYGRRAAFEYYMADSAVIYRQGQKPYQGHEAIMSLYPPDAPGTLTWEPTYADAAESGELGYTLGKYEFSYTDDNGEKKTVNGYYVTIWRLQADGQWKYVFDTGT
jgi:ketosteroid isomerase-like protein